MSQPKSDLTAVLSTLPKEIDWEMLARGVRMLGVMKHEHPQSVTYNEALDLAANYIRSFSGRDEFLPKRPVSYTLPQETHESRRPDGDGPTRRCSESPSRGGMVSTEQPLDHRAGSEPADSHTSIVLSTLPQETQKQDDPSRVEPFHPCVDTAGSTAEQLTGTVTTAERTETE